MYTKEIQELVLADYKSGRSARKICEEYKISRSCLYMLMRFAEIRKRKTNLHINSLKFYKDSYINYLEKMKF